MLDNKPYCGHVLYLQLAKMVIICYYNLIESKWISDFTQFTDVPLRYTDHWTNKSRGFSSSRVLMPELARFSHYPIELMTPVIQKVDWLVNGQFTRKFCSETRPALSYHGDLPWFREISKSLQTAGYP